MDIELQSDGAYSIEACGGAFRIRPEMVKALVDYSERGVPVGDFLRAVLSNNLIDACGWADIDNLRNLPAFAVFVRWEIPAICHGSIQRIDDWIERKRIEREAYAHALVNLDWSFSSTSDHRAATVGRETFEGLRSMQKKLDPRRSIWNSIVPPEYQEAS